MVKMMLKEINEVAGGGRCCCKRRTAAEIERSMLEVSAEVIPGRHTPLFNAFITEMYSYTNVLWEGEMLTVGNCVDRCCTEIRAHAYSFEGRDALC